MVGKNDERERESEACSVQSGGEGGVKERE
jgi:hypothetical protein